MTSKQKIYWIILVMTFIGLIASFVLAGNDAISEELGIIFIVINGGGVVTSIVGLMIEDENKPITEEELNKLKCVGREQDGSYCDRWQIIIKPDRDTKDGPIVKWSFCLFSEDADEADSRVKYVKTMSELKKIYEAVTDKTLE